MFVKGSENVMYLKNYLLWGLLENVIVYKIIKFWRSTVTFVLESTAVT